MPLSDDEDDDNHVQVTPRRRVPLTTSSHDDSDLVVKGSDLFTSLCEILFNLTYFLSNLTIVKLYFI